MGLLGNEKLADTHVDSIISSVEELFKKICQATTMSSMPNEPCRREPYERLFDDLRTKRGRMPYLKTKFGLVPPKEIYLPMNFDHDFRRHRQGCDQYFKHQNYQYIPLFKQLQQILSVQDIYQKIYGEDEPELPGHFSSFKDGSKFQESVFFKEHRKALQIFLYLDEVQMCNPLGSKSSSKRKLVFVYFSLGNLSMRYRSGFHSIYLLSIFTAEQVEQFGINVLLRPIVEDLKKLESGVDIEVNQTKLPVYGTLVAIIADNLASHQLGGFKCGFSKSFRKCRTCLGSEEEIQSNFSHASFITRTKEMHEDHCKLIGIESLEQHYSKLYGINHRSIFNDLKYFHVIGGLPPDIMHDILEGILPQTISRMLRYYIAIQKIFKLKDLNHWILNHDYGPNEIKNKPSAIKMNHLQKNNIRQSSSQTWLLATVLPLIIGNKIPSGCSRWSLFKDLLEISRIVFSESISYYECFQLKDLVHAFLTKAKRLNMRITVKMHNLTHYPYYIRLLGPLKNFWAMRFESKHAFFKKITRVTNFNFINAPATLAERHQVWLTNKIHESKGNLLKPEYVLPASYKKKSHLRKISSFTFGGQICETLKTSTMESVIHCLPSISINGSKILVEKSIVLCPLQGSARFQFGKVTNILVSQEKILFVCQLFRTLRFNNFYQAYEVISTDKIIVFEAGDLNLSNSFYLHRPSFSINSAGSLFIVTKQSLKFCLLKSQWK